MSSISNNKKIYDSIILLIQENKYKKAEKFLREFFYKNSYENNEYLALQFVKCLRKNLKYEEAKAVAEKFLNCSSRSLFYAELVFINIALENYEEAYKFLLMIKDDKNTSYTGLKIYGQIETFLLREINDPNSDNIFFLDNEENHEGVIKHIKLNHGFYTHREDTTFFYDNIDIDTIFNKLNKRIKEDDTLKYLKSNIVLYYYFRVNEYIGYSSTNNKCNIICVVTHYDKNIVTIYPVNNINSKYLNEFNKNIDNYDSKKLINRKSQIEKFNERYSKN